MRKAHLLAPLRVVLGFGLWVFVTVAIIESFVAAVAGFDAAWRLAALSPLIMMDLWGLKVALLAFLAVAPLGAVVATVIWTGLDALLSKHEEA